MVAGKNVVTVSGPPVPLASCAIVNQDFISSKASLPSSSLGYSKE